MRKIYFSVFFFYAMQSQITDSINVFFLKFAVLFIAPLRELVFKNLKIYQEKTVQFYVLISKKKKNYIVIDCCLTIAKMLKDKIIIKNRYENELVRLLLKSKMN